MKLTSKKKVFYCQPQRKLNKSGACASLFFDHCCRTREGYMEWPCPGPEGAAWPHCECTVSSKNGMQ